MIPSLIEIKILVKRPIFRTLGNKGLSYLDFDLNFLLILQVKQLLSSYYDLNYSCELINLVAFTTS